MTPDQEVSRLIHLVRGRWRALRALHAVIRAALGLAALLGVAFVAARGITASPAVLASIGVVLLAAAAAVLVWAGMPLWRRPTDAQIARFIEERIPDLDDRLVTAVDLASTPATGFDGLVKADAARRSREVDTDRIIEPASLRRVGFQAVAAAAVLAVLVVIGRNPVRESVDAMALTLFPARVALEVVPGNVRVRAGDPLAVRARLVGNRAPVIGQFQVADGDGWRSSDMTSEAPG